MNQAQIKALAESAGLPADKAEIAAAIAIAESGGNEKQVTIDNDDESYGLWQINYKGPLKGPRTIEFGPGPGLLDPAKNARAMSTLSHQGQNFNAWTTYTHGIYKKYLNNGSTGITGAIGNLINGGANAVTGGIGQAQEVLNTIVQFDHAMIATTKWITNPENWLRILYVAGGAALVTFGLYSVISKTDAGKAVAKGAKTAVATGATAAKATAAA